MLSGVWSSSVISIKFTLSSILKKCGAAVVTVATVEPGDWFILDVFVAISLATSVLLFILSTQLFKW